MSKTTPERGLSETEAKALPPGSAHYTAYVGPPLQYDFMGATQFRLLTTLGLRDQHRLLDFGCGSLRAGRLFIPYLAAGNYFGLEPNRWLIEDAIANQIGQDMVRIKQPAFLHHEDFDAAKFGVKFDFILAQSIFSHTGRDVIEKTLQGFAASLAPGGRVLATFILAPSPECAEEFTGSGWVYPGCVGFSAATLQSLFAKARLHGMALPWYHPRQTWFVLAKDATDLPGKAALAFLTGTVLCDAELAASIPLQQGVLQRVKNALFA